MEFFEHLDSLKDSGRFREFSCLSRQEGSYLEKNGAYLLNLCSNDYLGVAGNSELQRQFFDSVNKLGTEKLLAGFGLGSTSSRLLSGNCEEAVGLEGDLQLAYGRPALLFNSGYHANIGILPTLAVKGDLILSDKLNHASIHDGLNLSRASHIRFPHCDYDRLKAILEEKRDDYSRVFIVSESVFSMDGDVANLKKLVAIKKEFNCLLYIDEAHGVGVYGERGLGIAEKQGVIDQVDFIIGTFGKAYGSLGAYLICKHDIRDYLINHCRSLIFTTALPAINYHWSRFIFNKLLSSTAERVHLQTISDNIRDQIKSIGLRTAGSTNIIPVIIGAEDKTVALASEMAEFGYHVLAVRPPTVPTGTSRFRLSLCSNMTEESLAALVPSLEKIL
ncbi:MAG: 8-amino-7-oxononanoate synthase [Desulfotalea sp.]